MAPLVSIALSILPAILGTITRSAAIVGGTAAVITADTAAQAAPVVAGVTGDEIQAAVGTVSVALAALWGVWQKLRAARG